jgi:hypothetical protein
MKHIKARDAGRGLSDRPSDNWSPLEVGPAAWPWIDALHAIDSKADPTALIRLLGHARVPDEVMPYVADLLKRKLTRRVGRPSTPLYELTRRNARLAFAAMRVRELVQRGVAVREATRRIAEQNNIPYAQLQRALLSKDGAFHRMKRARLK